MNSRSQNSVDKVKEDVPAQQLYNSKLGNDKNEFEDMMSKWQNDGHKATSFQVVDSVQPQDSVLSYAHDDDPQSPQLGPSSNEQNDGDKFEEEKMPDPDGRGGYQQKNEFDEDDQIYSHIKQ